ncbi:MAG: hypothetical protein VX347_01680 [Bacteroidota bacterium]|nr:hypothetical protein [Bacteroidota bacterium]
MDSQPESLDLLSEIPKRFQGTFILIDKDTTTYVVTSSSVQENSSNNKSVVSHIDSTMIIKGQGNTLYINKKASNGFECTRISLVSSFNYEKIEASSINIMNAQDELQNIEYEKINYDADSNEEGAIFLIKKINYNQLQKLFRGNSEELIRIK